MSIKQLFLWGCVTAAVVALTVWAVGARERLLYEWIKIEPSGVETRGRTVATDEGQGFEGEPTDSPGLVISKWSTDIGLEYRNAKGRELKIMIGGNFKYHYQLSATQKDANSFWSAQVAENHVSIREESSTGRTDVFHIRDTNKMQRTRYFPGSDIPWEGHDFKPGPDGTTTATRYQEGQPVEVLHVPIDMVVALRDRWSTTADSDYAVVVRDRLRTWQGEMTRGTRLPTLENEDHASLTARYFSGRH
jgi:hypothetical protein